MEFGDRHLVIVGDRVAQLDIAKCSLRETGFQTENSGSFLSSVGLTKEGEHLLYMLEILRADMLGVLVLIYVIVLLAEGETCLVLVEDIHRGVHGIGIDIHCPQTEVHGFAQHL